LGDRKHDDGRRHRFDHFNERLIELARQVAIRARPGAGRAQKNETSRHRQELA
jgi:hypothetical protein